MKKTQPLSKRINTVRGQLLAITEMLERGDDCVLVLTQLKAAQAGLSRTVALFLEENLRRCMVDGGHKKSTQEIEHILKELTK